MQEEGGHKCEAKEKCPKANWIQVSCSTGIRSLVFRHQREEGNSHDLIASITLTTFQRGLSDVCFSKYFVTVSSFRYPFCALDGMGERTSLRRQPLTTRYLDTRSVRTCCWCDDTIDAEFSSSEGVWCTRTGCRCGALDDTTAVGGV